MRIILFILLFPLSCLGQFKTYSISELDAAPKIDGVLDEAIWQQCEIATDFVQIVPSPGQASNFKSEVKLCYSQNSIFVGAVLYQKESEILKQLTARDGIGRANVDIFSFILDPYRDKQNGFAFKVSAAGVQQEERLVNGGESGRGDISWDAVWSSKVSYREDAWVVEMEIPFAAIRFPLNAKQNWGMQFFRLNRKQNEESYWSPVNPQQRGFLAQAGELSGIENIKPPVRLALFPYVSIGYQQLPSDGGNSNKFLRSGGMDIKYGLNEAFTLDMTLIPDFSQVISDNLIRNTSAFEQQLSENRPFFTEGTELFNKQGLFYSRRIGQRPQNYYTIESDYSDTSRYTITKNPNVTSLYNSFKISGRTKGKLGIGLFNALAAPARARVFDKTLQEEQEIDSEPLTNYNIFVLDQTLGGQSFVNFTNTNAYRDGTHTDGNVSALQLKLFDKKQNYLLDLNAALSARTGETSGTKFIGEFAKVSGRYRFGSRLRVLSPSYNQTDLGLQFDFNEIFSRTEFAISENKPKSPHLQFFRYSVRSTIAYNMEPRVFKRWQLNSGLFFLFKNFVDLSVEVESNVLPSIDFYQLGAWGRRLQTPSYVFFAVNGSTDSRRRLFWSYYGGYGTSTVPRGLDYISFNNGLRYRVSNKLEPSIQFDFTNNRSNVGYSFYDEGIGEAVAALRFIKEQTLTLQMQYNFSPDLNFTGRFRHYNSKIRNQSFHRPDALGNWMDNPYAIPNIHDENFNLQNIDLFLNWIYAPGSRMVLSYKQWLNDAYILNTSLDNSLMQNFQQIIKKPKAFEFACRFIYYLDYNRLRKPQKRDLIFNQ